MVRGIAWLMMLFALPWLAGCESYDGPPRAAVRGKVTLDGEPLSAGVIRFVPTGSTEGPGAMAVITDGAFELPEREGPVIGTHRVEIESTDHYGFAIDDEAAFVENVEKRGGRMPSNPVPEIYHRRSTLTAEVAADSERELEFHLHSQGQQTAGR